MLMRTGVILGGEFPRTAAMKCKKTGWLRTSETSHSSGSQKSEIRMCAGP